MVLERTPGVRSPDTASPILIPFNDRPRILATAEINTRHESLSRLSDIWTEAYVSPNGMAGVVAHWGERRSRIDMDIEVEQQAKLLGLEVPHLIQDSGFDTLYRIPEGYTDAEIDAGVIDADVMEVGVRIAREALELRGWEPKEVDHLRFGNSVGKGDIARELAVKLRTVNAKTSNAYLACNSAGYPLVESLQDEASLGGKTLLVVVDALPRLLRDPQKTDFDSIQLFSNGAAALAYRPGVDLKYLTGVAIERIDATGITAVAPYEDQLEMWAGDDEHPIIFTDKYGNSMARIQQSPYGKDFWMRGGATAKFFIKLAAEGIASAYNQYKQDERSRGHVLSVIGHHASLTVAQGVDNMLRKKYGINDLVFPWIVPDGNSSGATSLIAFNRSMSEYKPGQHVLYASYGAGGTGNFFVVEIGQGAS